MTTSTEATHTITATVLDLNGILAEHNGNVINDTTNSEAVTAIVSFARRPKEDGAAYLDSETTCSSYPIQKQKQKQKDKNTSTNSIEMYEAAWYSYSNPSQNTSRQEGSSVILPADLYTNNIHIAKRKKKNRAIKLEIYDVMVHLVKASEPIPLGVTKLVISDTDVEDLVVNSGNGANRGVSNTASFHVQLCVKTLFRKVQHDENNKKSLSNHANNNQQETVLSFARSNGYTYGIDAEATLRVRLDVVENFVSSPSQPKSPRAVHSPKIYSTNSNASASAVDYNHQRSNSNSPMHSHSRNGSSIANNASSRESSSTSRSRSRSKINHSEESTELKPKPTSTFPPDEEFQEGDDESSYGNIDPKELLQGAGVSTTRSSSSKRISSSKSSKSRLSAAGAHEKQLKRLQRVSKKHQTVEKPTREEALWALQRIETQPTFDTDAEREKDRKKKEPLLTGFVNMFLDFSPCAAQCQVPTSYMEQSNETKK